MALENTRVFHQIRDSQLALATKIEIVGRLRQVYNRPRTIDHWFDELEILEAAFVWHFTEQGQHYWQQVSVALQGNDLPNKKERVYAAVYD